MNVSAYVVNTCADHSFSLKHVTREPELLLWYHVRVNPNYQLCLYKTNNEHTNTNYGI